MPVEYALIKSNYLCTFYYSYCKVVLSQLTYLALKSIEYALIEYWKGWGRPHPPDQGVLGLQVALLAAQHHWLVRLT